MRHNQLIADKRAIFTTPIMTLWRNGDMLLALAKIA